MKILAFIKQVPDSEARVTLKEGGKGIEVEEKWEIGYFDAMALEEAVRIKERLGQGEVVAVSVGDKSAIEALRTSIAIGADKACLIEWEGPTFLYPSSVSRLLASFAQKEGYDIILCGKKAMDDENGSVPCMVSALLGLPFVPNVSKIESIEGNKMTLFSEREDKRLGLEVQLPAVLTAEKGLNEPRIPSVSAAIKALAKEIPVLKADSLISQEDIAWEKGMIRPVLFEPPPPRPEVRLIEGTPEEKVEKLVELLKMEGVL